MKAGPLVVDLLRGRRCGFGFSRAPVRGEFEREQHQQKRRDQQDDVDPPVGFVGIRILLNHQSTRMDTKFFRF